MTLICTHLDFAKHVEDVTRFELRRRLARAGVKVSLATTLREVRDGDATVSDDLTGTLTTYEQVTVVLACGLVPDTSLVDELTARGRPVHVIGDALAPRRIMHATLDGARLGVTL